MASKLWGKSVSTSPFSVVAVHGQCGSHVHALYQRLHGEGALLVIRAAAIDSVPRAADVVLAKDREFSECGGLLLAQPSLLGFRLNTQCLLKY